MITLVRGKTNKIGLVVNSSVDISGFSAVLAACPTLKSISDITGSNLFFEFSSEDLSAVPTNPFGGTLIVCDAEGKTYLEFAICFRVVSSNVNSDVVSNQTLYLTIVSTRGTDGGSTPTPSGDYVTRGELTSAVHGCNNYTDEKISDIGGVIISTEKIEVQTPDGPTKITLQEAAQQVADMQADIEEGKTTHTVAHVEDEDYDGQPDGEVLYLNPSKPH